MGLMPHPQVPELQEITQSRLREGSARGGTETEGRTRPSFEIKNVAKGTQQRYKNQKTLSREAGDSRRGGQRPGRCRYLRGSLTRKYFCLPNFSCRSEPNTATCPS